MSVSSTTAAPDLLKLLSEEQNPPKSCIKIHVEEVFLHCAKAFMRSKLWSVETQINRKDFPTMGQLINDQFGVTEKPRSHKDTVRCYQANL